MAPYVRSKVTPSGNTAVQVVWSVRGGKTDLTQVGTARNQIELDVLTRQANQIVEAGQGHLDVPGIDAGEEPVGLIAYKRKAHLWDALEYAYQQLGFDRVEGADEVFKHLVLARIIEPVSKFDSLRVLKQTGIKPRSYPTVVRRLPAYGQDDFRNALTRCCVEHSDLQPTALVLFDCTTLRFECHLEDDLGKSGYKERRLEPQIVVALLTDTSGLPLMVQAFEGNTAEVHTIIPVIKDFTARHQVGEVTVVADAGMMSKSNLTALEQAGLFFVVGSRLTKVPFQLTSWHKSHPEQTPPDGLILTQPWPVGFKANKTAWKEVYQYRQTRAAKTLRGIDEQVAKAERAVKGLIPVKRNKYVAIAGANLSVNQSLVAKSRLLAGWRGYTTNLDQPDEFIIGAYHRPYQVEKSFRMSKHDLQARPFHVWTRQSIEAHLTIVFAALAVGRWIEAATGWSIKKIKNTLKDYLTIGIQTKSGIHTAQDPLPVEVQAMLNDIYRH